MCIIKFSTQQHKEIYDMTNNLKIMISVRGGNLLFLECFTFAKLYILHMQNYMFCTRYILLHMQKHILV